MVTHLEFNVSVRIKVVSLQDTEHVHTCVPWTCLCVLYMNKEEELGAVGGASERGANGQHLGSILISLA